MIQEGTKKAGWAWVRRGKWKGRGLGEEREREGKKGKRNTEGG